MKNTALFTLSLVLLASSLSADVVFRSRLLLKESTRGIGSFPMTFGVYETRDAASPLWTKSFDSVAVDSNGVFQVTLSGAELDELVLQNRARFVGTTVNNGDEIFQKREILPVAKVASAKVAKSIAGGGRVGEAAVDAVFADNLVVDELSIGGKLDFDRGAMTDINVNVPDGWKTLGIRGSFELFREKPFFAGYANVVNTDSHTCKLNCVNLGNDRLPKLLMLVSVDSNVMPGTLLMVKGDSYVLSLSAFSDERGTELFNALRNSRIACYVFPLGDYQ